VVSLETRMNVTILPSPDIKVRADSGQLDQLLINLVKNAADAALATSGGVRIGWQTVGDSLKVSVEDDGPGLANTENLFVPFFSTKPDGSGVGLVLSRQIAEAHGGALAIVNREDGPGCRATVRLPMA
jgi:signal transduction histidine kinase